MEPARSPIIYIVGHLDLLDVELDLVLNMKYAKLIAKTLLSCYIVDKIGVPSRLQ
ncbi:hypothetical protein HanRHA438_Chr06g0270711 [Helianthus annuus]|nr:hypothetical protein HanRHA438_Chr06g0270711 [Helianthus annuus]